MDFSETYSVKIALIFRSFDEKESNLLLYSTQDSKKNKPLIQELAVLRKTYKNLEIKVNQLLPIHSRQENCKWLIQKDEHRYISFFLIQDKLVDELQVLTLRKRVCKLIKEQEELLLSTDELLKVNII
jgi:hypothetical protein